MSPNCRHIRANGARCGSPALRYKAFCYWHTNLNQRHRGTRPKSASAEPATVTPLTDRREPHLAAPPPEPAILDLPALEDAESVQVAVSMLVGALARNTIDPKRAAVLLYGLQVATGNVRRVVREPARSSLVSHTVLTPEGDHIAPA